MADGGVSPRLLKALQTVSVFVLGLNEQNGKDVDNSFYKSIRRGIKSK